MITNGRIGIPTGTWKLDKAGTRVGFVAKSFFGLATVRGEFRDFDGALEVSEGPAETRAYGQVDAGSVDTDNDRRDKHLRSTDFLSAESHPELTFRSTAIEPVDDTFRVLGDLSINGVTNEVELTAKLVDVEGGGRIGLEVAGRVSRKAFAMTFLAGLGSAVVADEVKIAIDAVAVQAA